MIREVEAADYNAWSKLWQGYLSFYRAQLSETVTARTFDRLIKQTDGMVGLVAVGNDGELLGFAHLVFHPSTWSETSYCYLEDLFVLPEHRRKGYGRALLGHLARLAVERGCGRIEWAVLDWNEPAIAFYRSLGARTLDDWRIFRVTGEALGQLAGTSER